MAKIFGRPIGLINPDQSPRLTQPIDGERSVISVNVNGGMVSTLDSAFIPDNCLKVSKNTRIRPIGGTSRRNGTVLLTPTKPDALKVLELAYFKKNDKSDYFLRFTKDGIYKRGTVSWSALTGTLSGTDDDRFNVITVFDNLVFSNNGADEIQVINSGVTAFAQLGNAPKYKFITPFFNRVVAGYFNESGSENPIQVGWSGDANLTEWDPLVDLSAGSNPLIENPSDTADFITGMFGFSTVMIIPKEHSIWLATKQPSATNPFNFFVNVPGQGCNCPYATAVIPGGIIYADTDSQGVFIYIPGSAPEPISSGVFRELFSNVDDPNTVFASYDKTNAEYSLAITPAGSDLVKVWMYNLKTRAMQYDERQSVSCMSDVGGLAQALTIDTLPGPSIDSLMWAHIDDIGLSAQSNAVRVYGFNSGDIQVDDISANDDAGAVYATEEASKIFNTALDEESSNIFIFSLDIFSAGVITFYYSRDKGRTYTFAKSFTFLAEDINENRIISFKKNLRSRNISWKLITSNCLHTLLSYKVNKVLSSNAVTSDQI